MTVKTVKYRHRDFSTTNGPICTKISAKWSHRSAVFYRTRPPIKILLFFLFFFGGGRNASELQFLNNGWANQHENQWKMFTWIITILKKQADKENSFFCGRRLGRSKCCQITISQRQPDQLTHKLVQNVRISQHYPLLLYQCMGYVFFFGAFQHVYHYVNYHTLTQIQPPRRPPWWLLDTNYPQTFPE